MTNPRIVDGPEITGQVVHKQTGQVYGGVTVTVSPKVYTDREMTASVTSLTADGTGVFSCYAPPGTYTFTTTAVDAQTLESVEVLGREGGTGVSSTASLPSQTGQAGKLLSTDGSNPLWAPGVQLAQAGQTPSQAPVAPGTAAVGALGEAAVADHVHPSAGVYGFAGPGTDGAIVFDGTTNLNSFSGRSGTTYTLTRDVYGTNITVNTGVTIVTMGFAFCASGTLTVQTNAYITTPSADGNVGVANRTNTTYLASGAMVAAGMYGQNGGTGVGTAASGFNSVDFAGGGGSGAGGAGGSGAGGGGTATGAKQAFLSSLLKRIPYCFTGVYPAQNFNANGSIYGFMGSIQGGAGGASGAGDGTNSGGAGGSGGGVMFVNCVKLAGAGTIATFAGNGGIPSAGNCGGGGGGGGGVTVVNTTDATGWTGTVSAPGGSGGNHTGTGANGSAGNTGIALLNILA